jgi:hypothetical protein
MLNENAILNLLLDVDFLQEQFTSQGRAHLMTTFTELRVVSSLLFRHYSIRASANYHPFPTSILLGSYPYISRTNNDDLSNLSHRQPQSYSKMPFRTISTPPREDHCTALCGPRGSRRYWRSLPSTVALCAMHPADRGARNGAKRPRL